MKIGYACKTVGVRNTNFKSCTLKSYSDDKVKALITYNLKSLNNIINYNIEIDIRLFRISSDIIPFGSKGIIEFEWWKEYQEEFIEVGNKIKENGIRVSMHPGQYTVLNSKNEDVVLRAIKDLEYHVKVLEAMELDNTHKIILHIGGGYDDKKRYGQKFINNFKNLEENIKKRIVVENDDRIYNIEEVLYIGESLGIPVVFDNLHNYLNPATENKTDAEWIDICSNTWADNDGDQKIHYSQQAKEKRMGSHSDFIRIDEFLEFFKEINSKNIDIMLEVKDKNLSCKKCINCTNEKIKITELEKEWRKYKYSVLEKSHKIYLEIRELLKEKEKVSAITFYEYIEKALEQNTETKNFINAANHVWGYFKDKASIIEKKKFLDYIEKYKKGEAKPDNIKKYLNKLALKYNEEYLINSYYFDL